MLFGQIKWNTLEHQGEDIFINFCKARAKKNLEKKKNGSIFQVVIYLRPGRPKQKALI